MQRAFRTDVSCGGAFGDDEFVVLPAGGQRWADDAVEHADEHGYDGKADADDHRSLVFLWGQFHPFRDAAGECGDQSAA